MQIIYSFPTWGLEFEITAYRFFLAFRFESFFTKESKGFSIKTILNSSRITSNNSFMAAFFKAFNYKGLLTKIEHSYLLQFSFLFSFPLLLLFLLFTLNSKVFRNIIARRANNSSLSCFLCFTKQKSSLSLVLCLHGCMQLVILITLDWE